MEARQEAGGVRARATAGAGGGSGWRDRAWRYVPLALWIGLILFASTGAMAAQNTSRVIGPLLKWLFPRLSESQLQSAHFAVRKLAHFTEYAVLALLAARAFHASSRLLLRRRWFAASLLLVVSVALLDEFNQSFNPARTSTIKDSLLDTVGGLTALTLLVSLRARRERRS